MNETFAKSPLENETEQEIELAPDLENTQQVSSVYATQMWTLITKDQRIGNYIRKKDAFDFPLVLYQLVNTLIIVKIIVSAMHCKLKLNLE